MSTPKPIVITSIPMSATTTEHMQHQVEEMINIVNSDLPKVQVMVSRVRGVLVNWRNHFNLGKLPLSQSTMHKPYMRSQKLPIDALPGYFKAKGLPEGIAYLFENMVSSKRDYAISDGLREFSGLFHVVYEGTSYGNNARNGVRIFVGEQEGHWVKAEYNALLIQFVMDCVFGHRVQSPFFHKHNPHKTHSLPKYRTKWLSNFNSDEFAYVAACVLFILGESKFRLVEGSQVQAMTYEQATGSAFWPTDPNKEAAKQRPSPPPTQNATAVLSAWEEEDEVTPVDEGPELLERPTWSDDDDDEEPKAAEEPVQAPSNQTRKKRNRKTKQKRNRSGKKEREANKAAQKEAEDEKRWAEDAAKPDGWDLEDLPEGMEINDPWETV